MRAPEHDEKPREMEAAPAPAEPRTAKADGETPPTSQTDATEPALHKQVERYRPWYRRERRAAAGLVAISLGTIGASAGLFAWTASSGSPPVRLARDVAPPTLAPDPGAAVADEEVEAATALLAADDAIGEAVDRVPIADGAPAVRGVATAADGYSVIALWTDRVVWVSRDDGRSFRQELAAPEPLTAVAVGPDGRVYAARHGGRLGLLSPAGHTRWLDVDCDQVLAIATAPPAPGETASAATAPWLAVLGLHADSHTGAAAILWLSDDHGHTWRNLIAPHHGDVSNRLRVSPDGVIDLLTEDSDNSDSGENGAARLRHHRGHVDGRPFALAFAGDAPAPLGMGHDGLSWRLESKAGRMRLAAAGRAEGRADGPGTSAPVRNWDVRLAAGGVRTLAVADGHLLELGQGRPRVVTRRVPGRVDTLAVDGIGRAVATVGGSALRYSRRHGWRRLFEIPPR